MARLFLSLLGPLDTRLDGEPVIFATDKAHALLVYLAVESDHPHRRDALAGLLWPDQPQRKARQNLRQALAYIHKVLGAHSPSLLLVTRETMQFNPNSDYVLDVAQFDALYAACRNHRHRRLETCRPCLHRLEALVALYRGEFLEHFFLADSEAFEEWALFKREWYHLHAVESLAVLAQYEERRGDIARAREYTQWQVTLEPWREEAHRTLMRLLAAEGQRSAALMQYEKCRRILTEELGVEPTAETTALYAQIRAGHISGALLGADGPGKLHNLPRAPTSFVGRDAALRELAEMIANPDCRLITLVGPGGIGKSRLARQVAGEHVGAFAQGVWLVPLATVDTPDSFISAIIDALDITVHSRQDHKTRLLDYLRDREILLVLDGLEQVQEADARFLTQLLRAAPDIVVIVTSRERINLQEEWAYPVRGLDFPAADGAAPLSAAPARYDAVTLFVQRARQVDHRFALSDENLPAVTRICQLVEGMPLAVELAAAWVATQTCAEIAQAIARNLDMLVSRLRDVPARHRSIRVAFEHSWQWLTDVEQRLFARLSVFAGGFTRERAVAVTGVTPGTLAALLDKSLIRLTSGGRYDMHALIRHYAAEKLRAAAQMDTATRARHARHFMDFLAEREPRLQNRQPHEALTEIAEELDNVRLAWQVAVTSGWGHAVAEAAGSLYAFYDLRCRFQEGIELFGQVPATWAETPDLRCALGTARARRGALQRHLDRYQQAYDDIYQGLTLAEQCERPLERVFCLTNLAEILRLQGRYTASLERAQQALALSQRVGDRQGTIYALYLLGMTHYRLGDVARAETFYEQSLALAREAGNPRLVMSPLNALGDVMCHKGDYVEAQQVFEECLAVSRDLGDRHNVAVHLNNLGTTLHIRGQLETARPYYQESLAICRQIGDQEGQAIALSNLGEIACALDAPREAQALYQAGLDIGRRVQDRWTMMACLNNLGEIACRLEDYAVAQAYLVEALHIARETHTMPMLLKVLSNLGVLLAAQGHTERAVTLLGIVQCHPGSEQAVQEQAQAWLDALGLVVPDRVPVSFDALIDAVLADLA